MAAELSSKADLPIVFGSVDMVNKIEPTEMDEMDMDEYHVELPPSADSWAINTPPPEFQAPKAPTMPPSHSVDLCNENEIEAVHAQQQEIAEDPLQLF